MYWRIKDAREKKPEVASFQEPALAGERSCQGCSGMIKVAVRAVASMVNPSH